MNIGPIEIVIVLVLALLVFGPKRLPQMGKSLGKGIREFRNAASTARTELGLDDVAAEISSVKSTVNDLKSSVDIKAAVEAPVPAAAAAAGAAAASAAPAAVSGEAAATGDPAAADAPDAPDAPETPAAPAPDAATDAAPEPPAAPEDVADEAVDDLAPGS